MRLLGTIIWVCLVSCGQPEVKTVDVSDPPKPKTQPEESLPEQSGFPQWLKVLYPAEVVEEYQLLRREIVLFENVNDSVTYCVVEQNDGVCQWYFLLTQVNRVETGNAVLGHNCDHDQSRPEYSWKEYSVGSTHSFKTIEYTETVHDSLIDENGHMKEGYEYESAEKLLDTAQKVLQVTQSGKISEERNWR